MKSSYFHLRWKTENEYFLLVKSPTQVQSFFSKTQNRQVQNKSIGGKIANSKISDTLLLVFFSYVLKADATNQFLKKNRKRKWNMIENFRKKEKLCYKDLGLWILSPQNPFLLVDLSCVSQAWKPFLPRAMNRNPQARGKYFLSQGLALYSPLASRSPCSLGFYRPERLKSQS